MQTAKYFVRRSSSTLAPPMRPVSTLDSLVELVRHCGPGSEGYAEGQTAPCVRYPNNATGLVVLLDYARPRRTRHNRRED